MPAPQVTTPRSRPAGPDQLLAELIALNGEMAEQLRREHPGDARSAGFLTGMIEQHEKAAALLQARLDRDAVYLR